MRAAAGWTRSRARRQRGATRSMWRRARATSRSCPLRRVFVRCATAGAWRALYAAPTATAPSRRLGDGALPKFGARARRPPPRRRRRRAQAQDRKAGGGSMAGAASTEPHRVPAGVHPRARPWIGASVLVEDGGGDVRLVRRRSGVRSPTAACRSGRLQQRVVREIPPNGRPQPRQGHASAMPSRRRSARPLENATRPSGSTAFSRVRIGGAVGDAGSGRGARRRRRRGLRARAPVTHGKPTHGVVFADCSRRRTRTGREECDFDQRQRPAAPRRCSTQLSDYDRSTTISTTALAERPARRVLRAPHRARGGARAQCPQQVEDSTLRRIAGDVRATAAGGQGRAQAAEGCTGVVANGRATSRSGGRARRLVEGAFEFYVVRAAPARLCRVSAPPPVRATRSHRRAALCARSSVPAVARHPQLLAVGVTGSRRPARGDGGRTSVDSQGRPRRRARPCTASAGKTSSRRAPRRGALHFQRWKGHYGKLRPGDKAMPSSTAARSSR